eukprot:CAMPEP_0172670212 /NCGR_PEP_ID=MMETSP1074-20121228/10162_1 /TAXON_ID=2916 /ORGANISM="Ceratium fusus, Strain PA161109" /LENGTH=408 /DNA_ID=CAMNT_0013487093 /DNA_START=26 /DNA_END=1252 /DNA_ORIENTATION=+
MAFFSFSVPPGPLRAHARLLYLCGRSYVKELTSPDFFLSLKRICILVVLAAVLPALVWWNALGFFLDDLFFPGYRSQKIEAPIFIQGCARTGTTALHRLLAKDPQLTTMATWEMAVAPSVTWRRLFVFFHKVDQLLLRGKIASLIDGFSNRVAAATQRVHKVQLFGAEEDEWLMTHIGAAQLLAFLFPLCLDVLGPVIEWEEQLPPQTKAAILSYYTKCIQRHLYAHGGSLTYVAKNPTFNRRIRWVQKAFPDARFIVMIRTPSEAVPSLVSYIGSVWNCFCSPRERCPFARVLSDLQPSEITYPIDALSDWPATQRAVVTNRLLRSSPLAAIQQLYRTFGLELSVAFHKAISNMSVREEQKDAGHQSHLVVHEHSIAVTGMTEDEFNSHFAGALERLRRLEEAGEWS